MPRPLKPLTVAELIEAQARLIRQLDASKVHKSRAARIKNLLLEALKELKALEVNDNTMPF
jgi:YesN/AraC family two-component response regulator